MSEYPYNTQRWLRVRKRQLMREPLCCACHAHGLIVVASEVDHVSPIKSGGAVFDPNNLQSLCKRHHSMKTNNDDKTGKQWDAPALVFGCDIDGKPIG
jgi:5-methylcytosine-specific restriction enzyme A